MPNKLIAEPSISKADEEKALTVIEKQIQKPKEEELIFPKGSPEPKVVEKTVAKVYVAPKVYDTTGDPKLFIYTVESGNNPARWNSSGCVGLGQACPASKLLAVCPNLDYECEDAWFTKYMEGRYHTWEKARQFWLANHWW